jgi:Tol biopolymer transport system component/tRNA A-37 threonylcarbamoyl transferase component Bud32
MSDSVERLSAALADRYRIERELGQGGMAIVYLAEDLKHHRKVAVKVLRPELAAVLGSERFLREIETTASLHHPHILALYDSGESAGFLYYVMPFVEGESLRNRLDRERQLPLDDALQIAREVADALSYAHTRAVIHRDIKPENILLESGHAIVADFGIAKAVVAAGAETLTQTGISIGTPQYMSPEQAAGQKDIDGRSDLYSLACVLYEMLTGQPPFSGPTVESVVRQHMVNEARPVSQLRPAVPPAIADVVTRALAKNPADRFSPAAHFAAALVAPSSGRGTVEIPRVSRARIGLGIAGVLAVVAAIVLVIRRSGGESTITIGRTIQVTREAGLEVDPALSPDGENIAYAAGPSTAMQIYVRQVSGGRPVALTNDTTDNFRWPRWSPDGTGIAYQSNDGIYVVPALGGTPRRVTRSDPDSLQYGIGSVAPIAGHDWSPDGSRIAWTHGYRGEGVTVVTLSSGDTLTLPAPATAFAPAWSPDGRSIAVAAGNPAFIFGTGYFGNVGSSGIWIVHLDRASPTRITTDSALNVVPQWSPDGRDLFWVSDRDGNRDIYRQRINANGSPEGAAQRLTTGTDAQGISLSRRGGRMAYSRLNTWSSIWSIPVPAHGSVSIRGASPVTTGNETIETVDVSADGHWLVFDSDRNGNSDLYVMPASGGESRQLTTDPAGDFNGDWSPDGRRIVFHSRRGGNRDVYTVEADGTGLRQWTSAEDQELDADWAPDGETILFQVLGVKRGFGILRVGDGARPEFVPIPGADFAQWSPVGRAIVYHSADGLRLRRLDSGEDTLLVSNARDGAEAFYAAWSPDGTKLFYLTRSPKGWSIRSVPAAGGSSIVLVDFDDPARQHTRYGFATDGQTFYLTLGSPESDVWVADLEQR